MTRMMGFRKAIIAALAWQVAAPLAVAAPGCTATSGEKTAALVELYTSEGCSSCPPADTWLHEASQQYRSDQLVPLALHVPYWDNLGWKDSFSQPPFAQRQSWLVGLNGHRTVYTPHFFVSGIEMQDWQRGLENEVRRVNRLPAAAHIEVNASWSRPGVLAVASEATTPMPANGPQLFLAFTENGLASEIRAGENRGTKLSHNHVVRALVGPLPMASGRIADLRELQLDPGWLSSQLAVVAFVQDGSNGRVLQAVTCTLGR